MHVPRSLASAVQAAADEERADVGFGADEVAEEVERFAAAASERSTF